MSPSHPGSQQRVANPGSLPRLYQGPGFEEAQARIEYMVAYRRSVALVLGSAGVGKTTLLTHSLQRIRREGGEASYLNSLGVSGDEFLANLAERLLVTGRGAETRWSLWRAVQDRLEELRCQGLPLVLLIDHLDQSSSDLQTMLLRLLKSQEVGGRALTTILAIDEAQRFRVHPALLELCELRIELEPWALDDTIRFLEDQYVAADGSCPFLGDAAVRLQELSQGTPRRIVHLARLAQLSSMDQADIAIDAETISDVYDELSVSSVAPATAAC